MHIILTKRIGSESYNFDRTALGSKYLRVCLPSTGYRGEVWALEQHFPGYELIIKR
jgi:hypothetical protein